MKLRDLANPIALTCLLVCLVGCNGNGVGPISTGITQMEVFDFNYMFLEEGSDGKYAVSLKLGNGPCEEFRFTKEELIDMLRDNQFLTHPTIGGRIVPTFAGFTFEAMEECHQPLDELKYETAELVETVTDSDGNTEIRRPQTLGGGRLVDIETSPGGVVNILVHEIRIVVHSAARSLATGPMEYDSIEVPGTKVGRTSGIFSPEDFSDRFFEFSLDEVLTNPDRIVAGFNFTATTGTSSSGVLLIWDGDLVLRTDL